MILGTIVGVVWPYVAVGVVTFVVGVLVGRKNIKTVNTVVADVKADIARLEALFNKTAATKVVAPVATTTTTATAITGSK